MFLWVGILLSRCLPYQIRMKKYKSPLNLPDSFWRSYETVLKSCCLFDVCLSDDPAGKHGGISKEESESHFAQRCGNSCSRTVYIIESDKKSFCIISTSLLTTLSSDTVGIVDLAAGSGGGTLGLLCSLENLRSSKQLPCTPLTIHIYAADFSEDALLLYEKMINDLRFKLRLVGIELCFHKHVWDAKDVTQASSLCDTMLNNDSIKEYLVLVSALSGVKKSGLDPMTRSFHHVLERFSGHCMTSLWVEPGDSGVDFLRKVVKVIYNACPWLASSSLESDIIEANYKWIHEIQKKMLPGRVSCVKYDRKNLI